MRLKRLQSDWYRMQILNASSPLIDVESFGDPPERYVVSFFYKGLVWMEGNSCPSITRKHQMEIYLHKDYPRLPPQLKWLTDIFHPNILPPQKNGGVCIGKWTPMETLDQLCIRVGEMVQYRNFNISDPLDLEAARWAAMHIEGFPLDQC